MISQQKTIFLRISSQHLLQNELVNSTLTLPQNCEKPSKEQTLNSLKVTHTSPNENWRSLLSLLKVLFPTAISRYKLPRLIVHHVSVNLFQRLSKLHVWSISKTLLSWISSRSNQKVLLTLLKFGCIILSIVALVFTKLTMVHCLWKALLFLDSQ